MTDFLDIYNNRAADYDRLVSCEDHAGNLLPAIEAVAPLEGRDVVEMGAGTGRVTRLLAPRARAIRAYDASGAMLEVARNRAAQAGHRNCTFAVGRNENLPCESATADLAIAGWTFGHLTGWHPQAWRDRVRQAVNEMRRVLRPGGIAIVIETLGTGHESPHPPTPALAHYYAMLEDELGFQRNWIRTDYQFRSTAEATELVRFFFGDPLAEVLAHQGSTRLPECTGLWVWDATPRGN